MVNKENKWLDKKLIQGNNWFTLEIALFFLILLIAVITRFYDLGSRAMSHDESLHTYFSYLLSQGQGYQHNPMMHGPLQFHLIALSYFLFGSSDFVSRIPAATFGILAIGSLWLWRRYLGRVGTLVTAALVLISPFITYYSRYTREDSYIALSFFLMLYAVFRYFESGEHKYIYLIAGSFIIHYLTKETSFIYNAEMLIFLAIIFIFSIVVKPWENDRPSYKKFSISLVASILFIGTSAVLFLISRPEKTTDAAQALTAPSTNLMVGVYVLLALFLISFISAVFFLLKGYGLEKIRASRSFDLLIVFGSLVLPQLSAFPVALMGWDPVDYSNTGLMHTAVFLLPIILVTIVIGVWWKRDVWLKMSLIFWAPYVILYTTVFTNGSGFFTGIVGSLGYWISQQGVERGSQPWYYYIFLTIPIYEFLPAIASMLAVYIGFRNKDKYLSLDLDETRPVEFNIKTIFFSLLTFWSVMSIVAFTVAGEKMPWLTFHMALPMTLLGGWAIGKLIEKIDWDAFFAGNIYLKIGLYVLFILSFCGLIYSLFQSPLPFAGKELVQLQATTTFIAALVISAASLFGIFRVDNNLLSKQTILLSGLMFFGVLAVLTFRTTIRANYLKFDSPQEYLVYAHSYSGVKEMLAQVDDLSAKTVGGKNIVVAYDDDTSWPLSWYMREYPNNRFFGGQPDRSLKDVPVIIVGDNNYAKVEPIVGDDFYQFDYIRMVWPNQDYFNLISQRPDPTVPFDETYACKGILGALKYAKTYDFGRLCNAVMNSELRAAIFDVWLNRDFTDYGVVNNSVSINESTWDPADRMRLYVKKDVVDKVWNYGVKIQPKPKVDPYAAGQKVYSADVLIGTPGTEPGQFNAPRGIAVAPDGSVYVTDSRNHRVQQFGVDGSLIRTWGTFGDQSLGDAPMGTFNEPWGIAVAKDGTVYVSDTWNHRIQKFTPEGKPLKMWGTFGTEETPGALYGPRGITITDDGRVFVADTGNKRIMIYDTNGAILGQFGSEGFDLGQFSEPTDVKFDSDGFLYVTDTWNQRIQVFSEIDKNNFTPVKFWDVNGWNSQTLDNKPYLTITGDKVFITDPEGYRVIEFKTDGSFVQLWGEYGTEATAFGLPNGIAADADGNIWIADSANNRLMRFLINQ